MQDFIGDLFRILAKLSSLYASCWWRRPHLFFYEERKQAFGALKKIMTSTLIIQSPNWCVPFEIMCDASDYTVGVVLGQRVDKLSHVIYYASKTLNNAQLNYSTTEKELLAIVSALYKFRSYLLGSKVIIYSDHAALKYLFSKKMLNLDLFGRFCYFKSST